MTTRHCEQLMATPYSTFPRGTELLKITLIDGTCTVSKEMLNALIGRIDVDAFDIDKETFLQIIRNKTNLKTIERALSSVRFDYRVGDYVEHKWENIWFPFKIVNVNGNEFTISCVEQIHKVLITTSSKEITPFGTHTHIGKNGWLNDRHVLETGTYVEFFIDEKLCSGCVFSHDCTGTNILSEDEIVTITNTKDVREVETLDRTQCIAGQDCDAYVYDSIYRVKILDVFDDDYVSVELLGSRPLAFKCHYGKLYELGTFTCDEFRSDNEPWLHLQKKYPKIGSKVKIMCLNGNWVDDATVFRYSSRGISCKTETSSWYITNPEHIKLIESDSNKEEIKYKVGDEVDAMDNIGGWYLGKIIDMYNNMYTVHFYGWLDSYNETVPISRLEPKNTRTCAPYVNSTTKWLKIHEKYNLQDYVFVTNPSTKQTSVGQIESYKKNGCVVTVGYRSVEVTLEELSPFFKVGESVDFYSKKTDSWENGEIEKIDSTNVTIVDGSEEKHTALHSEIVPCRTHTHAKYENTSKPWLKFHLQHKIDDVVKIKETGKTATIIGYSTKGFIVSQDHNMVVFVQKEDIEKISWD